MRPWICLLLLGLSAPALAEPLPSVRWLVSNATPYLGEELVLTLEIRSAPGSRTRLVPVWPRLDAFSATDLPWAQPRREGGGATTVLVQTATKVVRPLRSGPLLLDAGGVSAAGTLIPAPPTRLQVRALPTRERPADFSGAVGTVHMTLEARGSGTREVVLNLQGAAPLGDFPRPKPQLGAGERLVPLGEELTGEGPGMRRRSWHYLYLPGAGRRGDLGFALALFDPGTGRFQTLTVGGPAPGNTSELRLWFGLGLASLVATGSYLHRRRRRPKKLPAVLQHLLGRPAAGLPRKACLTSLRARRIPEHLLTELEEHWRQTDLLRFGPGPTTGAPPTPATAGRLASRLWNAVDKSPRLP